MATKKHKTLIWHTRLECDVAFHRVITIGDFVIWFNRIGEQCPAQILKLGKGKVKIEVNAPTGDFIIWVKGKNIKHQID
jgi:hypothetical protein